MNQEQLEIENLRLKEQLEKLQLENMRIKEQLTFKGVKKTVTVPEAFKPIFDVAEKNVAKYFSDVFNSAENGEIEISGERYILIRSASLSYEFLDIIKELYSNESPEEAVVIGNNFLFDIGHVLGKKDSKSFHTKMKLTDPIQKLSAGPVHFAYSGWANVEILPESNPTPDDNFVLKYHHHNSFEAQSWIKSKKKTDKAVCVMNAGYSSGWCEESFGMSLTAIEISCEAKGDNNCTFIMAPPHKIEEYINEINAKGEKKEYDIPVFFNRKIVEDKLRDSLVQTETLLKEVHHRVKNNLQIISSLFKLQLNTIGDKKMHEIFLTSLNRVNTMAQVHELIYSDKDLSSINIESYFRKLMHALMQLYFQKDKAIEINFHFELADTRFNPDIAIPLGLILNEMASNAFKYALNANSEIVLTLKDEGEFYYFTFSDNGPGLPKEVTSDTLGLSLISLLSEQIDAELVVDSKKSGLKYSLKFKK